MLQAAEPADFGFVEKKLIQKNASCEASGSSAEEAKQGTGINMSMGWIGIVCVL